MGRFASKRTDPSFQVSNSNKRREFGAERSTSITVNELDRARSPHESAVLVGVRLAGQPPREDPLGELRGLAETAGATVVGELSQRREQPDPATYLGKGKVLELKNLAHAADADVIFFDNDLSPGQTRSLEKVLGIKVLDRTEVILDIFATNARTHEARLAVELAQLEYSLPRLKRMWTHLSRMKMGIGMRGPGEKQLEVDRRLVEKRIHDLRGELQKVERRRQQQVASRRAHMTVSLVGYTNAGKSTLMNALTDARVLAEDRLFATLDTRTRRWQLPHWGPVLLSDTVGFIRDLPHHLIASFRATLEESRQADLLLHVADAANPAVAEQIASVYQVLSELDIQDKGTLLVLNKVDGPDAEQRVDSIRRRYPHAISVSAKQRLGLTALSHAVSDALSARFRDVLVSMSVSNGKLMAYLAEHGEVLSRTYEGERVQLHCKIAERFLGRIESEPGVEIRNAQSTSHGEGPVTLPGPANDSMEDVA